MNRRRDNKGRLTSRRSTPTTNSPTPSRCIVRVTPSSNQSVGRNTIGRSRRIVTTQKKVNKNLVKEILN